MEPAQNPRLPAGDSAPGTFVPSARHLATPSAWRAWCYLVWLSWRRQAQARQMVWIALALLGVSVGLVLLRTTLRPWSMEQWRFPRRGTTYQDWSVELNGVLSLAARSPAGSAAPDAVLGAWRGVLARSDVLVYSRAVVFTVFLSFLLPVWSLSFATETFGGEREAHTMVWLLTRPLPRPAVYLAKFVALLPWSLGLNVGGFALLCLAAGRPGRVALQLYWPAVCWGTLAFSSLFCLIGAIFRWPAVVSIVYSFFLETFLGNMPGYLKRASISFYTRCMMFDVARQYGVQPEKPSVYLPVDGTTACLVLAGVTVVLLLAGMAWFSRAEYISGD
jgi:ABC-2 type transport system permease protein